ncbi:MULTISPECIES: HYC_CC_PP family protein [Maribacter]|uniref:Uncharacterized protein n=1 Tax=Maribacter flavus TaxID=1658664 RepID=A0ABU7IJ94_9FLAO|nr:MULTISPECIES: hypothetical protein [Maribacter]MDC6405705.1 hypothetical protein [Maribacter sp. PR66]MEE1973043.1 hypothetical protein [Maribacter flavus]
MKASIYKIAAIAMALLVLFSTMSFTVDMHYCGDHLVDFSLSRNVDTCLMNAKMTKSPSDCPMMEMKMDCCSDEEVVFEGHDDLKLSMDHFSFDQHVFIVSFVYAYISLFEGFEADEVYFKDYSPPPLIRDVQVLHQTFLI